MLFLVVEIPLAGCVEHPFIWMCNFVCLSWKTSSSHSTHRTFFNPAFQWVVTGWHFSFNRDMHVEIVHLVTFNVPLKKKSELGCVSDLDCKSPALVHAFNGGVIASI